MALLLVAAMVFISLALVALWAWRGDGRTDLRRCPRCWYDMAAVEGLRCPECGHAVGREAALFGPRRRRGVFAGAVAALFLAVVACAYVVTPGHWTTKTPRPVVRLMLDIWAAPPKAPLGGIGTGLPMPNPALMHSPLRWERLVWQHQALTALLAWEAAVFESAGPIDDAELARLAPLAEEAHALYQKLGGLSWNEGWVTNPARARLAERRDKARGRAAEAGGSADELARAEWALAELQFEGGGYAHRPDFARVSDAIIVRALNHADAGVRSWGLDRYGRRVHEVVMDRAAPLPIGEDLVAAMAAGDADVSVRKKAANLLAYVQDMLPKK